MRKYWPGFLLMLLVLTPWLVSSASFFYNIDSPYSDLTISHLPNAMVLLDAVKSGGEIPLWSNLIMSGSPFAADPLSGIWYPPGWLAFLLPQPLGFNLTVLLYILWGGIGMAWLLLMLGLRREAAFFGGVAFLLMPKVFSHLAAGHVTLIYAVSWTPWLFLAEMRRENSQSNLLARITPGALLGLIVLADPRWGFYAGGAWLALLLSGILNKDRKTTFWPALTRKMKEIGLQTLLAFILSAILILPMAEFTRLSSRATLSAKDVLAFSLPSGQLLGLIFPDIGGYWEWQVYPGALILLLMIYGLFNTAVRRKGFFWLLMAAAGVMISLGSAWPFAEALAELPFINLLRVPSRAWFLTSTALVIISAYSMDSILDTPHEKVKPDPIIAILPLVSLAVLLVLGLMVMGETPPTGFIWGAVSLAVSMVFIALLRRQKSGKWLTLAALLFLAVDLGGVNWLGVKLRSPEEVMGENARVAEFLARQEGRFRVFSPDYSIPQYTAALHGLELIDGINPLHLADYQNYLNKASGLGTTGYSVRIPELPVDGSSYTSLDTKMLGLLNGKYVVAGYPIANSRLIDVWHEGGIWIYENMDVLPRIWVRDTAALPGQNVNGKGIVIRNTPNLVEFKVDGPGMAVISMPDYPAWSVSVDGGTVDKLRIENLLIGVRLEDGSHKITLEFQSASLILGRSISLVGWVLVIAAGVVELTKRARIRREK